MLRLHKKREFLKKKKYFGEREQTSILQGFWEAVPSTKGHNGEKVISCDILLIAVLLREQLE